MKTGTSLTDAEIVKAFDCCYTDRYPDCTECPRYNREKEGCMDIGNGNIYDLPKAVIDLINRYQANINRLKAENKNCEVKIQNQREQLKACNEKIKRLEVDNDRLKRLEFQADALNEAYEESVREVIKEVAEQVNQIICENCYPDFNAKGKPVNVFNAVNGYKAIDNLFKKKLGENNGYINTEP